MFGRRTVCAVVVAVAGLIASTTVAHAQTTTTAPYGPPPKYYIVVDQATGAVLAASNERMPAPPASLTKVLTALVAVAALRPNDRVPISERAAGMPAHKLSMKAGEVWNVGDVLSSLLASSANDAAAALAERVSGSLEDFQIDLNKLAAHLQLADAPTLQDPSGLDDHFSVRGGNLISARDLAIAARALLAEPRLAPIVARPLTEFVGPDGVAHRLVNHNKMLTRYLGTVGMKTGYTKKSGRGLIAAATRDDTTLIAVVMNVADTYGWAAKLLDAAFAAPARSSADRLPAIPPALRIKPVALASAPQAATEDAAGAPATGSAASAANTSDPGLPLLLKVPLWVLGSLVAAWSVLRARVLLRRRRRRANVQIRRHVNRRRDPALTPHYKPHDDMRERFHEASRR